MMHLTIRHSSTYRFATPARYVVQSHRLEPSRFDGQDTIRWSVTCEGARFGVSYVDAAGDRVRTMTLAGPVDTVTVHVEGEVVTRDLNGVLSGNVERVPPLAYLRHTPATRPDEALNALAVAAPGTTALDLAHSLSVAVSDAIAYRPGVTHQHTTAAEALAQGEGVCQDHAHALISAARVRDLPARYVSGYLRVTEDTASEEAGHAWAEIFIAGLGWIGFDAANRCCPDDRYVRLGSGLDAQHAAPIRGISLGHGVEALEVVVAVGASQQ